MERSWAVLILLLLALPTQAAVQLYYLHNDHLGTPRVVTNQAQQVVWKGQLKPFGEMKVEVETITNHRRFPGQRLDIESRLYYNYFRDYDPSTGRYIQSDPIGLAGGLNTYTYVSNNPLIWIDPRGLDWEYDRATKTLTQIDSKGKPIDTWPAVSGPWGKKELPPGKYTLPSPPVPVPPSHRDYASYCDGANNCWWQPIKPDFETKRFGLGIHPDGKTPGTAGCIGATDKDTTSLRDALMSDQGPLTVK